MRRLLNTARGLLPNEAALWGHSLYNRLPYALRYGRHYRSARRFLQQSQWWTREQHDLYQLQKLQQLLAHAYTHIPFYHSLYSRAGVHPHQLRTLDDIKEFPTIDKTDLQQHLELMRAQNMPARAFQYHTTGGSTGQPTGMYWEADRTVPVERAFMQRQFEWIGFRMGQDRSILIRGIPVSGGEVAERLGPIDLRLSIYHMTESTLAEYIRIIQEFQPVAIQAYPSSAYILAQHILESGGARFPSLKVVLCGSENLYPWQRQTIAQAFGCRVYSWYGHSEYAALGGECECSERYHFYSEYGLTELLRGDGTAASPGERGEIVATGFNNMAMPLIRYRTQDFARRSTTDACPCGRHYLLVDAVEGRLQEMIVSDAGNLVPMTAINMHTEVFDNVLQFQFVQQRPGHLDMHIIPRSTYSRKDEKTIQEEMMKKIGHQFTLDIHIVDSIPTTATGKSRFLVQHLPLKTGHEAAE